jgi:hypothetical protein
MSATYRPSRWQILAGLLTIPFGIAAGIAGVCLFLSEPEPGAPPWRPTVVAIFCVFPVLLCGVGGLLMIVDVLCRRLIIDGDSVTQVGIFRTKQINLAEVVQARWRLGGAVILKTLAGTMKVDISGYRGGEARQLIKFFHLCLPAERQRGWEKFWEMKWRSFDEPDPTRREEFAEATRRLRRRYWMWLAVGVALVFITTIVLWCCTGDADNLRGLAFLVLLLPVLALTQCVSAGGKIAAQTELSRTANASPLLVTGCVVLMLGFLGAIPFALLGTPIAGRTVMLGGALLGCLLVVIGSRVQERKVRPIRSMAAKLAEEEYMQPQLAGRGRAQMR